jgi:hypothetical protein
MNTKIRVKKREVVIPFDGEEMFVVPKKGGFGQPDNEHYVMAVGNQTATPSNLPNDGTSNTTTGTGGEPIYVPPTNTTTTTEPAPTTPPPATAQQLCVAPDLWVNGQCLKGGVETPPPNSAEATCVNGGGSWINGACVTSNSPKNDVINTLPNFPVWSTLDCTTLKDKIAEYNAILSTSKISQQIAGAYAEEIAKAQAIYNGKCNVTPPAPITILPVGGGDVVGGGGGIGGGGGFGEPPMDVVETPPVEEKKSDIGLFLIIGGIALLYFLTKKNKN